MKTPGQVPSKDRHDIVSTSGFSGAVRALLPALRRYAQRLTHNPAASDDLVQDTLASAWKARERFEPGTNLKAWLFRILRNRFLTETHRRRREIAWDPDLHERRLVGPPHQEEQLMLDDLKRLVDQLPEGYADALRLVAREGLSYDQAAERLGVPRGTLGCQIHRARMALLHGLLDPVSAQMDQAPQAPAPVASKVQPPGQIYARWKQSGSRMIG